MSALADTTNETLSPAAPAAKAGDSSAGGFKVGQTVWYTSSDGDELKARVTAAGDELNLNIREDADPARVRLRDATAEASDEEEDYGHLNSFEVGQCVWYKNSEGEEMKARVTRIEGDEVDLNIRDEADMERVRTRDPEGEASDDDEYDHLDEEDEEDDEDSGEYEENGCVYSADGQMLYSVEDRETYFRDVDTDE